MQEYRRYNTRMVKKWTVNLWSCVVPSQQLYTHSLAGMVQYRISWRELPSGCAIILTELLPSGEIRANCIPADRVAGTGWRANSCWWGRSGLGSAQRCSLSTPSKDFIFSAPSRRSYVQEWAVMLCIMYFPFFHRRRFKVRSFFLFN